MNHVLEEKAQALQKKQRRKKLWVKLLTAMACVVVFCTTYALILPAITAEAETFCGLEAHAHTDACYEKVLVCGKVGQDESHTHTAQCYTTEKSLVCTLPEADGHTHTDACKQTEKELICTLPEAHGHTHTDSCKQTTRQCICGLEGDETHTHTEDCYEDITEFICGKEESQGHTHGDDCYRETTKIICGKEEAQGHTHSDDCYQSIETLTCGFASEETGHVHTDACYEKVLVCEKEAHTHDKACYSDPTADVETQEIWEDTLPEELTGDYRLDVLRMADSQLGYTESTKNYTVLEDGSTKGYSRYGAWYGDAYGDWCAMFVSFCLSYAEVEDFPLDANCQNWIETLEKLERQAYQEDPDNYHKYYVSPSGYEPEAGDIIFFNWDDNPDSDHVGLVYEFIPATEHTKAAIRTIEGNSGDRVQYVRYTLDDSRIMGYGRLPEQVFYCGKTGHIHDEDEKDCQLEEHIHQESCFVAPEEPVPEVTYLCGKEAHEHGGDCYDENGTLICEKEAHTHTEDCLLSPLHICNTIAHSHSESCYDKNGNLICGKEEHEHTETCFEDHGVGRAIVAIDALPTYEEIQRTLDKYEAAEDYDTMETWYAEVSRQVCEAYQYYWELTEAQKALVYNAEKLLALEVIWSAETYGTEKSIESDAPTVAQSASTAEFVELNLYDYTASSDVTGVNKNWGTDSVELKTTYPGFQWNGGAYFKTDSTYNRHKVDYIDFGNSIITDGTYTGSRDEGNVNGINKGRYDVTLRNSYYTEPQYVHSLNSLDISNTYGVNNRPIGMSLASSIKNTSYDVLQRTLGEDGYPVTYTEKSLSYLFTNGDGVTKQNTTSIDGLFQKDEKTGAYYYNSRWNHAQYSDNKFTLYNQIITPNFIVYPFGNFLPFNSITDSETATQVSKITYVGSNRDGKNGYIQSIINRLINSDGYSNNLTKKQLVDMLAMYRTDLQGVSVGSSDAWEAWSAKDAILDYFNASGSDDDKPTSDTSPITDALLNKMYNIDWDVETNFFFGMEMTMNFFQPKGGMTGNDNNGDGTPDYNMEFYFTGDDDVWVYIDGVLFLDLSGIHRHVGGKIDFVNGTVSYYALDTSTGDVSSTPYRVDKFADILDAAGKSTEGLNEKGTFKDYSTHQFKFFYTERGSGSSVCRINFNFPMLKQNSISISKEVSSTESYLGSADYKFQVLKANSDNTKTSELFIAANTPYDIYAADDLEHKTRLGTGTTDANGIITLKAGQQAVFEGLKENSGKYYVRELMSGTVLKQYGNVTVSGKSTTTSGTVTVGSDTFTGYDSPVKDMADGATAFRFTNTVETRKFGTLTIEKQVTEYGKARSTKSYDIEVKLNDTPLPVGTAYTVGNETKTVAKEGIITLKAGEKATISNILAGTAFTVQETSGSAKGYVVTYTETDDNTVTSTGEGVSGVIKAAATVQLVVNNTEKGAVLEIPVTKTLTNPGDGDYIYTFTMVPVADQNGTELSGAESQSQTVTVKKDAETATATFLLNYVQTQLEDAEINVFPHIFYYKITENVVESDTFTAYDATRWIVAVTVSEGGGNGLKAELTGLRKDGEQAKDGTTISFTNTLLGSLTLKKCVTGTVPEGESFTFTITMLDFAGKRVTCTDTSGISTELSFDEQGEATVSLKQDESITISGIPAGTQWTIQETGAQGYVTTVTVADGEAQTTTTVSGTLNQGETNVVYTNRAAYQLPYTGSTGIRLLLLLGAGLTLTGGGLLLIKRRKAHS